jgi:hypothetical protein
MVHLAVADVNLSQNNRLDLYWIIGDPKMGKWNSACLVDRRGFTSWSHPWSAAWSDKVHLIWDGCDVSINKRAPGMGAFHVERTANGFGRKTRIFEGAEWRTDRGRSVVNGTVQELSESRRTYSDKWSQLHDYSEQQN